MVACCGKKSADEEAKKLGMIKDENRKMTDLLFLIVFVIFFLAWLVVGIVGIVQGQPERYVFGTDYEGNVCGSTNDGGDSDHSDAIYTVYPRTVEDLIINSGVSDPTDYNLYGVCVESCPEQGDVVCNYDLADKSSAAAELSDEEKAKCIWYDVLTPANRPNATEATCDVVAENCWVIGLKTKSTAFRCLPVYAVDTSVNKTCSYPGPAEIGSTLSADDPACLAVTTERDGATEEPAQNNLLFESLSTQNALWGRYFSDLSNAAWVIAVCALVVGLILGAVWLWALQHLTRFIVWSTIVLVILLMIGLTLYTYYLAGIIDPTEVVSLGEVQSTEGSSTVEQDLGDSSSTAYRILAYILTALTIVVIGVAIFFRTQIQTAIRVIEMASKAVSRSWDLYLLPLFNLLSLTALLLWGIYVAAAIGTMGTTADLTTDELNADVSSSSLSAGDDDASQQLYAQAEADANSSFTKFVPDQNGRYLLAFHFFGILWINQFIAGVAMTVVAIVTAGWYFNQNKEEAESAGVGSYDLKPLMLANAFRMVCRFHLGTIAIGSFLIALIQFIRAVLAYVHKKIKDAGGDNVIVRWVMCICQSILKCIEWCVKVISRNAYIFTAVKGHSYCTAALTAIKFIMNNLAVFAILNTVTTVFFLLGKLLIAATAAFAAYGIMTNLPAFQAGGSSELSSAWLPALFTLLFGYAVAAAFFGVVDMAIDTILIAFTVDRDEFDGLHGRKKAVHAGDSTGIAGTVDSLEKEHHFRSGTGGKPAAVSEGNPAAGAGAAGRA